MKKLSLILWLGLILYTIIYVIFFGRQGTLLPLMLQGQADPFAQNFFNLMGLVPIYFLLDYALSIQKKRFNYVPFLLGFLGGAYVMLIGYFQATFTKRKQHFVHRVFFIILLIATAYVMMSGLLFGNASLYFQQFFHDPMVGIMVIDFLVLYVWSIRRSYQLFKHWYVSFLPMIGFGILYLLDYRR